MNKQFINQLISLFQQHYKKQSIKIMPIDSKPNLLFKPLMDQPLCKAKTFLKEKVSNFYLTFYVMLEVLLSVISNGLKTFNMLDQEE
jgi:hypothetical protein